MALISIPGFAQLRDSKVGQVYNEAAFKHFLLVDRRRAARSDRTILVILISLRGSPGRNERLDHPTSTTVFSALRASVREVDFVGWYRDGYVAAAVLAHDIRGSADVHHRVAERVLRALKHRFPNKPFQNLLVRVVRIGGHAAGSTEA